MRPSPVSCSLAATALLSLTGPAAAQLSQPGVPASELVELDGVVPSVVLPPPDVARLLIEDQERGDFPFRYGAPIATSVGLDRDGLWSEVPGSGALVWRVEIASPGAYSLGLLFSEFRIPEGGYVFAYDPDRANVLGAYTSFNEQANGMLGVEPLPGDRLILEYVQEAWVTEMPRLVVGEVVHDYRDVLNELQGAGGPDGPEAACQIDINCPEGAPYQDIKRAVVQTLVGGGLCSAGLLNNTAEDGTPYFLTADHCGNMANGVFVFEYERTGCSTGGSSQSKTVSGATRHARSNIYDSQLYRMNNTPPAGHQPFYAGWGRGPTPRGPAVGIHHPAGLPKQISIDDDDPSNAGNMWQVDWEDGLVQGGSSGSPLFNERGRIIGPACCVNNFSCANQTVSYGRFDRFWNIDNLGKWLDPLGLGVVGLDGYDPHNAQAIPYYGSNVNPRVYTSNLPQLGSAWTATVDTSAIPDATTVLLVGYSGLSTGQFFGFGELLFDLTSTELFSRASPVIAGSADVTFNIPNNPGLVGAVAYSQALILGTGQTATNGIKLRVNN